MNVVMFTPGLAASAIGRMARLVVRALKAAGHQVTVVRAESATLLAAPQHVFDTDTVHWTELDRVRAVLAQADLVVHQIGNYYTFHEGCLAWMAEAPGVICLHDFYVGHLFWGWAEARRPHALAVVESWYGPEEAARFFRHASPEAFLEHTHTRAPMTEWISSMGTAVMTHSSWGVERVMRACAGPVRVAALPYDSPEQHASRQGAADDNMLRVLTVATSIQTSAWTASSARSAAAMCCAR